MARAGRPKDICVPGRYTFKVRALDILGADAVPATERFKIKLVKHKKHKIKH